jgi:cytidine deaminase
VRDLEDRELVRLAISAREKSYSPYSGFKVGACLEAANGVYLGCNIENAAYSPTNCAERTAFFKAIYEGERDFRAIAVAGWGSESGYAYPCGVCRQVMMEFCDPKTFKVIVAKSEDDYKIHYLEEILPYGFCPKSL